MSLATTQVVSKLTVEQLDKDVQQLPALSLTVMEVLAIINKGDVDLGKLEEKISRDQSLAARVLRVANSPFYGFASHIGTIKEACVVLGIHTVRNIVLAAGVMDRFPADEGKVFDRALFWQHAVGTGVVAKVMASHLDMDSEVAFTAGLLHDIGKLVLDAHYPDDFATILARCDREDCLLREAEERELGFDHALIGGRIAKHWKLPKSIREAIELHHQPGHGSPSTLADLIHVADIVCRGLEIGDGGDKLIPVLAEVTFKRLSLRWEDLAQWLPEVESLNASTNLIIDG